MHDLEKLTPDIPKQIKWDGKFQVSLPNSVDTFLEDYHHDRAALGVVVAIVLACIVIRTVAFIFRTRE